MYVAITKPRPLLLLTEEYVSPPPLQEAAAGVTGNKIEVTTTHTDMMRFGPIHRSSRILTLDPDETKW